eukprot:TRINITY_DN4551_c0_g1_i1.p1 TRINITY_DN4551_c0_g1~~TRINITY_DN4551_c0_g1_i1.p1  ORF type:complete len:603 (-),score=202.01 TRINITY_DN4551_c0_g1_i1:99-1907(-)
MNELWKNLEHTYFSKLDISYQKMIKKYENCLKKYYLVCAYSAGNVDKIREFFSIYGQSLQADNDWRIWFMLAFIKNADKDQNFEIYFTKKWVETVFISIANLLNLSLSLKPLPKLLSFFAEMQGKKNANLERLQNEIVLLKNKITSSNLNHNTNSTTIPNSNNNSNISNTGNTNNTIMITQAAKVNPTTDSSDMSSKSFRGDNCLDVNNNPSTINTLQNVSAGSFNQKQIKSNQESTVIQRAERWIKSSSFNPSRKVQKIPDTIAKKFFLETSLSASTNPLGAPVVWCEMSTFSENTVASGLNDGTICLWNVKNSNCKKLVCNSDLYSMTWIKDSSIIASGNADCQIKLWNSETSTIISQFTSDFSTIENARNIACDLMSCKLNSGASVCVSALTQLNSIKRNDTQSQLILWDVSTQQPSGKGIFDAQVLKLSTNPSHSLLATSGANGMIRIFDLNSMAVVMGWRASECPIVSIAFKSEDSILSASQDGQISEWNIKYIGKRLNNYLNWPGLEIDLAQSTRKSCDICIGQDGKYFAVTSNKQSDLSIYQSDMNIPSLKLQTHSKGILCGSLTTHLTQDSLLTGSTDQITNCHLTSIVEYTTT